MPPLISDFFSHKIHATKEDWAETLCEIAYIFNRLDGKIYDSEAVAEEALRLTGRWSGTRKHAAFRDEITAYLGYLGVCHIRLEEGEWVVRMTKVAKRFLICESPNVAAFLRIQLSLFQYPNAMGITHESGGRLRLQENAGSKTLQFIKNKACISPLRLLAVALKAAAIIDNKDVFEVFVTPRELYDLANEDRIYRTAHPSLDDVVSVLQEIRQKPPTKYKFESRWGILKHTDVFVHSKGKGLRLKQPSPSDKKERSLIESHLNFILSIKSEFKGYDGCVNHEDLEERISNNSWADYFDGGLTLSSNIVSSLERDFVPNKQGAEHPPLNSFSREIKPYSRPKSKLVAADPEATRIKKEKRNAMHAYMVRTLNAWLEENARVAKTGDSILIDLWAELVNEETYIFEIKSGGETLFEQIRKGLAQLYEYRYRYRGVGGFKDAKLCLVIPQLPNRNAWLPNYLCIDRDINLCFLGLEAPEPEFHSLSKNPL